MKNVMMSHISKGLKFAETVAKGNTYEYCEIVLASDLNFDEYEEVLAIGLGGEGEPIGFKGFFNGNGHTIRGMKISNNNGAAGMFAKLEGIVVNLQLEDCEFSGKTTGGIAAQAEAASIIVNCHVNAKVTGETKGVVAGLHSGKIFNSVATGDIVGETTETGYMENCYLEVDNKYASFTEELGVLDGESVKNKMNTQLPRCSGYCGINDLYIWENNESVFLSEEKADLLKSLTAVVNIDNKEVKLKGYYSRNKDSWCISVPAGYLERDMSMKAITTNGGKQSFKRKAGEEQILFVWDENNYLIEYLSAENIDTLYFTLTNNKDLNYVHKNKTEENPGMLTIFEKNGNVSQEVVKGFYGHGNDSWTFEKKSYNLKLENRSDILGMGENEDFALLAGYRKNSLMSFCTTTEMIQAMNFAYAPEFRLVNVFVEGEYAGVYYLVEKIEIDENRLEIFNLYEETKRYNHGNLETFKLHDWKNGLTNAERYWYDIPNNPEDISGGYILEADSTDYLNTQSRFVSDRNIHMTLKRFNYASKAEVDYIANYWQEFEDALFSETGYNKQGKYYTEYIDLESFATQWLLYELAEEASLGSSIYFYKESEITGDGLLHACYPWDMEQSYIQERQDVLWNVKVKGKAMYGYWGVCYTHEDFRQEVRRVWDEKLMPILLFMIKEEAEETENGLKNLQYYIHELEEVNQLETSRWNAVDPMRKCFEIKNFLSTRLDVLEKLLFDEDILETYFEGLRERF